MTVTYFIFRRKYADHYGFDIAVYQELYRPPVVTIRDVTTNDDLAFSMVRAFNRCKLSPVHLMDAVMDAIE